MEHYLKRNQTIAFSAGVVVGILGFSLRLLSNRSELSATDLFTYGLALLCFGAAAAYKDALRKYLKGDLN